MRTFRYLTMLCFALCANIRVWAQETTDSVSLFDLSLEQLMKTEIDVGSNVVKDIRKQPLAVTTINRVQLELSGARNLLDAIMMYVPGCFAVEDQDDVILGSRGLAPDNNSKVMLLINGQIANTEWFWGPASAILNSTYYDYIDKIEVIRGPGSVILGQGALLGVINIITKNADHFTTKSNVGATVSASGGMDNLYGGNTQIGIKSGKIKSFVTLAYNNYDGQTLRAEGWARDKKNEGFMNAKGDTAVWMIGTRLKRSQNNLLMANVNAGGFDVNLLVADQTKDLYNFYRDRNVFSQTLISLSANYKRNISHRVALRGSAEATTDNFALGSVNDYSMGGTRENRFGTKWIVNINEILPNNRLATGIEVRAFQFGNNNFDGNNFIANVIDEKLTSSEFVETNAGKTWGYNSNIQVYSFFIEDFQPVGKFDFFGALRFDYHPFWGSNISPRLGSIYSPTNKLNFRMAYQEGFRGAAGVHYGGGYKQDGLLSEANFDKVEAANITIYDANGNATADKEKNINPTSPEKMRSLEFTIDADITSNIHFYAVSFYNIITNVIDVGVIWRDAAKFPMVNIGTELPGDWNGYWYFKNTEGSIKQAGAELLLSYSNKQLSVNLSHSLVKLVAADDQQRASMYITKDGNFKAYPENITRLNVTSYLTRKLSLGLNSLYYYNWFSPNDQKVAGNIMCNATLQYQLIKRLSVTASVINLFNQRKLYPMNSNAGGNDLSDGAPAMESITGFLTLKYSF